MKCPTFLALLALFISTRAIGADFSEANGVAPNGNHIGIDGETGEIFLNDESGISYVTSDAGNPLGLADVCNYTGYPGKFTCKKMSESPLSGATYIGTVSKHKRDSCGGYYRIFLCVGGCSGVPKIFYLEPWEC